MRGQLAWLLGAGLAFAAATGWAADDDLSIVKKAVTADSSGTGTSEPKATPRAVRKGPEPQWLRVRIVDKGEKKSKVSINLPLSLVKAFGHDEPFDWHCGKADKARKESRCSLRLSDLLATLEAGQEFVQIDDEDATIRVYVE